MAQARSKSSGSFRAARLFLAALAAAFVLGPGSPALADHSLQNPCIICHTLKSTNVVLGSRNVLVDYVSDSLYHEDWYCGHPWNPEAGEPLDCSFCHGEADVGLEIKVSQRGALGSAHPVQVKNDHDPDSTVPDPIPSDRRILCNDCHDGTVGTSGGQVNPESKCSKSATDGYPNHINTVKGGTPPGFNDLVNNPPRLTGEYLPGEVDWTQPFTGGSGGGNPMFCFTCHDGDEGTDPPYSPDIADTHNILADYNAVNGGHNIPAMGSYGTAKLACYHCHDPHASVSGAVGNNESLIINYYVAGVVHPMSSLAGMADADFNGFSMGAAEYNGTSNDKALCEGCHNGTAKVEGTVVYDWSLPANIKFDFHQDVHTGAVNCLTRLGGCHVSVHNTNIYACTDCHDAVGSEFDLANNIRSRHDITLGQGSTAADNGCLYCHDVPNDGNGSTKYRVAYGGTDYTRPAMDVRQSLSDYDDFCLDCHDGSGTSFTVGSYTYAPPRVDRFFKTEGHGATAAFPSGNVAANVPCIECHLYHGSTAYKLLPGAEATTDTLGNVIKGAAGATTVGATFPIGDSRDSTKIDYLDYSVSTNNSRLADDKRKAWKFADYTGASWDTYYGDARSPVGTEISFGTSGDMLPNSKSPDEVACGDDADNSPKIGFCNACHFYNDGTDGTRLDGTNGTMGWVYTHEGYYTDPASLDCTGKEYESKRNNHKDCTECHDPHGSGNSTGGTPNLYMVRGKIVHGDDATWSTDEVVFTALTGCDSLDEDDDVCGGGGDTDDICAVCHTDPTLKYHKADGSGATHNEGGNCVARCHSHGAVKGVSTTNEGKLGFPNSGDCTACHGYPPEPTGATRPPLENYTGGGGAHLPHVAFLEAKTGAARVDYPTLELCGPCHGEDAYTLNHLDSGEGAGPWLITSRATIDIGDRAQGVHWGPSATYGGTAIIPGPIYPQGNGMDEDDSRCALLACHGSASVAENLTWFNSTRAALETTGLSNVNDGDVRNRACEGCHDETPARLTVYDATPTLVYDATAIDAAANYYAPISNYGRGGHGDPKIQDEDPFIDSDPSHTTRTAGQDGIDCTACHDQAAVHFPADSGNIHRIENITIEADSSSGLCNYQCHPRDNYPQSSTGTLNHHPSYVLRRAGTVVHDVVPFGSTKVMTAVSDSTSWDEIPSGSKHWEQSAYGAGGTASINGGGTFTFSGNPDKFVDWWGGNPGGTEISPQPVPDFLNGALGSPAATLPLERYVGNQQATDRVMCVTCHNPHGTDLFVFVPSVPGSLFSIPDNNMLRVRNEDNTLCNACH